MKLVVNRGNFYYLYPDARVGKSAIITDSIRLSTSNGIIDVNSGIVTMPRKKTGELEWQQQ